MERFCTYCGKPLPEDGVCDCQTAQEETTSLDTTQENAQVAEPQAAGEAAASPVFQRRTPCSGRAAPPGP